MITIGGKYILENTIELLKKAGVSDVILIVGHKSDKIINYFKSGIGFGSNITYIHQEKPQSIGDAIWAARDKILPGEYFLLIYGDILTLSNIFIKTLQSFNSFKGPVASICLTRSPMLYGNIYLDNKMRITKIIEKPKRGDLGNYVLAGVFVLPSKFFSLLDSTKRDMERALTLLIEEVGLNASIWEEDWIDMVFPWDILSANKIIMDSWEAARIAKSAKFNGDVKVEGPAIIEAGVVVESGTVIKGPCYIGHNNFIGNNVLIRKYTSIGAGSVIGYGVEMKNCVMFGNSKVGRLSFLGDSVIGENVDIGSGTMTVNENLEGGTVKSILDGHLHDTGLVKLGAFIGDNVKIGASNTLKAGSIINSGSIIPHQCSYPGREAS